MAYAVGKRVFGVTGNQGGSVVTQLLNDSSLTKEFKIRGVTRDISKPAAQDLAKKGVEVVTVSRSTMRWAEVTSDAHLLLGGVELSHNNLEEKLTTYEEYLKKTNAFGA
ncbi:hypothetical protein HBI56_008270 [Parastagonospora nodorum]|nr:hypothetical protein HBH51_010050 [Parastagonospora nodorum]KAH3987622.1 hypothetical protein HBH52_037370 [Parastagonospora nodorum]KAH4073390.1 hypothetical protein HBH50_053400 [Parastagonospora nodorum]KAH4099551.1 hypothetical protein HBH48_008760 [Parastagonospora nodorum]KAH4179584.1 hypothetical protein HBH43_019230 [Parastagonospora nodorum]